MLLLLYYMILLKYTLGESEMYWKKKEKQGNTRL